MAGFIRRSSVEGRAGRWRKPARMAGFIRLFVGGVAGVQISSRVVLAPRVAWRTPGTFDNYGPYVQPYTANLEISTRF
ncbi:MAG: hypothetical protein ACI9K2_006873 [Myxococcota bacterium]|jgi:hypothetical protein